MKRIDKHIEFLENQLKELRIFKQETEERISKEDIIEQRLEKIEQDLLTIRKAIMGK